MKTNRAIYQNVGMLECNNYYQRQVLKINLKRGTNIRRRDLKPTDKLGPPKNKLLHSLEILLRILLIIIYRNPKFTQLPRVHNQVKKIAQPLFRIFL